MKCALSRLVAFALGAVWVLVPDSASATLITFHSEADFLSNAPVVSTKTFDEFPSPTSFFTARVVIDQVVYEVDGPCHFEGAANPCWVVGIHLGPPPLTPPNDFGATFANRITEHRISFGSGNSVSAFGFGFLSGGIFPPPHWEVIVHEIDGSVTLETLLFAGGVDYLGLWSDVGISALTVRDFEGDGAANWSYDNVSRSQVSSTQEPPVPEPASLTLLGLGLAGIGARRWRQRKQWAQSVSMREQGPRDAALGVCWPQT